jgi:hypothetical protein
MKQSDKNSNTLIIFGGSDPEEEAARAIARAAGCVIATATTADGKKVHGGTAYQATGYVVDEGNAGDADECILFECAKEVANLPVVTVCDHHNPGDEGFGKGASQYWEASSLGQLCTALGVEPTNQLRMIAAGDHCPADAYRGKCPGINPEEFAQFRLEGKVAFYATFPKAAHKADFNKIKRAIELASQKLSSSALLNGVHDLREEGEIEELPEAALLGGVAYMATIPETDRERNPTGNIKIILGGHATPEKVVTFINWARTLNNRIGEPYGNPTRGFAGVVVKAN